MTPVRLRLSRAPGFRLQELSLATNGLPAVAVARPGPFGNPWSCRQPYGCPHSPRYDHGRDAAGKPEMSCCVDTFAEWLRQGLAGEESRLIGRGGGFLAAMMASGGNTDRTCLVQALPRLRGRNLACWCAPDRPCHAEALLLAANA